MNKNNHNNGSTEKLIKNEPFIIIEEDDNFNNRDEDEDFDLIGKTVKKRKDSLLSESKS